MATQYDSNVFLEEVVRSCDNILLPHLRKCTERFIDIVNHSTTQQKISEKFNIPIQNLRKATEKCINAISWYDKLVGLKMIFANSDIVAEPLRMFRKLQTIALSGLLSGDQFDFLHSDELSLDDRVKKFLHFIEEDDTQRRGGYHRTAFDDYLESWRSICQKRGLTQTEIQQAEGKLRKEFETATIDNSKSLEKCLSEISETCETLRQKLIQVKENIEDTSNVEGGLGAAAWVIVLVAATGPIGLSILRLNPLFDMLSKELTKWIVNNTTIYVPRSADKEWYDRTSEIITDYLSGKVSDSSLKEFIEREKLEPDLVHFNKCVDPWLVELQQKIESFTGICFYLPKMSIMEEIERISEFLHAVILNKPEMLKKHQHVVDEIIQDTGRLHDIQRSHVMYPLISFGQLSLPSGERKRNVKFQFVLGNTLSKQGVDNVLTKLEHTFSNITTKRTTLHGNIPVIQLDLHIEDNITTFVAQFIKKLADLKVRSILTGEFGLGGFRHAMNPAFNSIYSINCMDKAEGFISTYFSGSLNRGGEPYFCPNGWRRYSIDVGLTGTEFESKYGDWPVAYHGTEGHSAMSILLNGFRASGDGFYISPGEGAVYLSPSIEYSGHPRYARVWKVKSKYVQMVLQVRVSPTLKIEKRDATLRVAFRNVTPVDNNFKDNTTLVWVIKFPPETHMKAENGILVYVS